MLPPLLVNLVVVGFLPHKFWEMAESYDCYFATLRVKAKYYITSKWVHRESNLMFTFSGHKDQRKKIAFAITHCKWTWISTNLDESVRHWHPLRALPQHNDADHYDDENSDAGDGNEEAGSLSEISWLQFLHCHVILQNKHVYHLCWKLLAPQGV